MSTVFSLYRSYLRQVRALPHVYLRHFFRIKGADDFRAVLKTESAEFRRKKLKRVSKDLRRLQAANGGQSTAFDRMLDIAYGRVGKLRWELMEPLLSSPSILASKNVREESACSPAYSPELAALLTSGISRTTRTLQKHHLVSPPGLPARVKPNSDDAVLLGPLSRRRECNIRWRFFNSEWKKVYPPLQGSLHYPENHRNTRITSSFRFPFHFGFQHAGTLQELFLLAGSPSTLPDHPSKRHKVQRIDNTSSTTPFDGSLPVRWLRRRYQALLGRIPLLVFRPSPQDDSNRTYDVRLADSAITPSRVHSSRLRTMDTEGALWISDVLSMVQSRRRCK